MLFREKPTTKHYQGMGKNQKDMEATSFNKER